MEGANQEKRRFPRALFPCRIRILSQGHLLTSHTENVSEGGIRVILEENLKYYSIVGIELYIGKKKTVECEGRVVWVADKRDPLDNYPIMYDTGIEFVGISDDDKGYIKKMVDALIQTDK